MLVLSADRSRKAQSIDARLAHKLKQRRRGNDPGKIATASQLEASQRLIASVRARTMKGAVSVIGSNCRGLGVGGRQ